MPIIEFKTEHTPYDYMEEDDSVHSSECVVEEDEDLEFDYDELKGVRPSEFVEFAIFMPCGGELKRFSFEERQYLKTIYNSPAKRKLIMAGRQVEKSTVLTARIVEENGYLKLAGDVKIGDELVSMVSNGGQMGTGKVTWVSKRYTKPCVRITTRQGHVTEVAKTHPMLKFGWWMPAGELKPKDRLGVVRRCGEFRSSKVRVERIKLTAYLIGDGSLGDGVNFTSGNEGRMADFVQLTEQVGCDGRMQTSCNRAPIYRVRIGGQVHVWLKQDGLLGKLSADKFIPKWVFDLSRKDTALFLRTLWSTDGHIKKVSSSKHDIVYSSIAKRLVLDVQALLWKFGIPTGLRSYVPKVYEGTDKKHWLLRVETQEGILRFLEHISREDRDGNIVDPPTKKTNNNRDTYPIEINDLLVRIQKTGDDSWHGRREGSLHGVGLRQTLKYAPTKDKLQLYVDFFRKGSYDQKLVDELEAHVNTDLYWDEIETIEDIGEQECVDFEVENTHNFVADGFVTHNSTLLGNENLAYMAITSYFRCLYVSPSHTQTKVFSRDRIQEPIDSSPVLTHYTNGRLLKNVLEKKFVNGSQIILRFAFLNADRCLAGSSKIQMSSGERVAIRDLIGRKDLKVLSPAEEDDDSLLAATAVNPRSTGVREVVRLTTCEYGPLVLTPDHRVYTRRGWVEAGDLDCRSDFVKAPYSPGGWVRVMSVVPAGREEVFDLTVPETEAFTANGLMVHNCRGLPADKVTIDEFQDLLLDNIPVIEECASHSEHKLFTYAGTPKSLDNAIEHYWSRFSTQNEWSVPCKRHGTPKNPASWFWNILGEDNVGDFGLICSRCGAEISPKDPDCTWVSLNPNPKVEKPYEGYRIPQLMVPWVEFSDIKDKQKKYSRAKFHNEVLGRSFDSGTRPLTRGDMIKNSWSELSMTYYREVIQYCQQFPVFMGIDWGCHDDQTRILTPRGFVPFKDLTDEDEVAQFDHKTRQMSFVKPLVRTVRDWDGDLLHFKSKNVDMMLTPTHRMLSRRLGDQEWEVQTAAELVRGGGMVMFVGGDIEELERVHKDDVPFNTRTVRKVPYKGKVYCCKVPTGFIVTERNGKVAYQGNTGEGTFTVMSLGGYLPFAPDHFTFFYLYRFEGMESEPKEQLRIIKRHVRDFNVRFIGVDYGGGFWPNDELVRDFGADKVKKYQWVGNVKKKIQFDPKLGVPRFLCHRTEVMSDMFNAIKRGNVFRFPRWEEFEDPYARDFTNIFSEYNDRVRMNVYKHAPGCPDDTFHSCCFGFLASFYYRARPDVILPSKEVDRDYLIDEPNDII